jgi:hypothetical protein
MSADVLRRRALLVLFSDACPTDWLVNGQDDRWHSIVFVAIPWMATFDQLMQELGALLPGARLRRWKGRPEYQRRFQDAFGRIWPIYRPWINAVSFQERTMRKGKQALLRRHNEYTDVGRSAGFAEWTDTQGRAQMRHEFVNFSGHHRAEAPENVMVVLLTMAWFAADQYWFYREKAIADGGCEDLDLRWISDRLSGDTETRRVSEVALRSLVDHDSLFQVSIESSPKGANQPGDLLVDNLAGWFNAAIEDPRGDQMQALRAVPEISVLSGWKDITLEDEELKLHPVLT